MNRKIIRIDEEKCNGCGLCIPACPEGAMQIIDGKARLISDLCCDGLGACIGHCPEDAISIEEREAEPYDERKVMEHIVPQGENTLRAHLTHLREHGEMGYLKEALEYLNEQGLEVPTVKKEHPMQNTVSGGCPGSQSMAFQEKNSAAGNHTEQPSALRHWPVQMHLISPHAPQYQGADVVLAADCVAFSLGNFHSKYLNGKSLAIACPKLDSGQEIYLQKIKAMIDDAKINTLTVMIMQVPCCGGLLQLARQAADECERKVPVKCMVVGIQGDILQEEWV